ncbi:MAG: c-type cytochrome [Chloroflexota bacterium]|nr:c-type cytochrome [Chloroflexota bacterium]
MIRYPFRRLSFLIMLSGLALLAWLSTGRATAQQPPTPPPYDPASVPTPVATPIAGLGRALYLENCAPCHGETGASDGAAVAGLQQNGAQPPPHFADAATVWQRSPAEYFHITKFGNIQKLMPPWGNRLDDAQIWQTVYYAWSLHTNQAQVQSGAQLYTESCAGCHGVAGRGDGTEATRTLPNFADNATMIVRTPADLDAGWQTAHVEIGQGWGEDERRTVLDYVRTFSYTPPWQAALQPGAGEIQGQVRQGTPDGDAIATLPITLTAYVNFEPAQAFTTTTTADGRFSFGNLATDEGIAYLAETTYAGVRYNSEIVAVSALTPTQSISLPVYATTDDDSGVQIGRANWLIDQQPGVLIVGQIINFGNGLDRTFTGKAVEGLEGPATLALQVPAAATDIQFQDGVLGGRYKQVGTRIYDIAPLQPGADVRQIVLQYRLPFTGTSVQLEQQFLYAANQVNLLIPDLPGLEADAPSLTSGGTQTLEGVAYRLWGVDALAPLTPVQVNLRGLLPAGANDPRATVADAAVEPALPRTDMPPLEPVVPLAVGGFLLIAMVGGVWLPLRKQKRIDRKTVLQTERTTLVQHIAELDDEYADGALDAKAWSAERGRLKATLLAVAQELTLLGEQVVGNR